MPTPCCASEPARAAAVLLRPAFDADAHNVKALARHCQRGTVLRMGGDACAKLSDALRHSLTSRLCIYHVPSAPGRVGTVSLPHWAH